MPERKENAQFSAIFGGGWQLKWDFRTFLDFKKKILSLSRATGSVSIGNLSAFDVIGSKAREIVGDARGDQRPLILLPMETR